MPHRSDVDVTKCQVVCDKVVCVCVRELCATKLGVKELWVTLRRRAGRTQWCGEPRTGMNRPSWSLWHPEVGYMYFNDSWWIFMIFQYPRNFRFWSLTFFDPKICQGSHPTQSRRGLVSVAWHHQVGPKQPCSRPSLRVRGVLWEASMAFNGSNMLKSPTRMDLIRCKTPMESYLSNMGCIMMQLILYSSTEHLRSSEGRLKELRCLAQSCGAKAANSASFAGRFRSLRWSWALDDWLIHVGPPSLIHLYAWGTMWQLDSQRIPVDFSWPSRLRYAPILVHFFSWRTFPDWPLPVWNQCKM